METALHETESLEKEIRIAARPETVFSFLVDPAKMTRWMGINVTLDPRPGGIYRVDVDGPHCAWRVCRGNALQPRGVHLRMGRRRQPSATRFQHCGDYADSGWRRYCFATSPSWAGRRAAKVPCRGMGSFRASSGHCGRRKRPWCRPLGGY